jgi:hypothetical protein
MDNPYPALKRWATLGKALRACWLEGTKVSE